MIIHIIKNWIIGYCNSRALWLSHHGIWAIVQCSPNMVTVRVRSKLKISRKSVVFTNKAGKNSRYFVGVFNKTFVPLALVGYEMIIATAHSWNNRPFAWWRHFTATTRIPQDFAFLCKLGLLLSKPHWDYKIKMRSSCKWPIAGIYKGRIEILLHHECLSFSRCKDQDWDWKTNIRTPKTRDVAPMFPCSHPI